MKLTYNESFVHAVDNLGQENMFVKNNPQQLPKHRPQQKNYRYHHNKLVRILCM